MKKKHSTEKAKINWKKETHTCPKCGHRGFVDPDFGLRTVGGVTRVQSWCITCRSGNASKKESKKLRSMTDVEFMMRDIDKAILLSNEALDKPEQRLHQLRVYCGFVRMSTAHHVGRPGANLLKNYIRSNLRFVAKHTLVWLSAMDVHLIKSAPLMHESWQYAKPGLWMVFY